MDICMSSTVMQHITVHGGANCKPFSKMARSSNCCWGRPPAFALELQVRTHADGGGQVTTAISTQPT